MLDFAFNYLIGNKPDNFSIFLRSIPSDRIYTVVLVFRTRLGRCFPGEKRDMNEGFGTEEERYGMADPKADHPISR